MAYVKTNWVDNVTEANATTMNNIENGIYNLDQNLNNSDWQDLTLAPNITNNDISYWGKAQCKKVGNRVYLRGLVNASSVTVGNTLIATIPVGYRPRYNLNILTDNADIQKTMSIKASGEITIYQASASWISLHCSYPLD